jgi:hypothetical protein
MEVMLGGIYSHARLLDWVDGRIELGFARGSLQGSLGTDAGNLAKVTKFITGLIGSPVEVRAKEIAHMPDPRPVAAEGRRAHRVARDRPCGGDDVAQGGANDPPPARDHGHEAAPRERARLVGPRLRGRGVVQALARGARHLLRGLGPTASARASAA